MSTLSRQEIDQFRAAARRIDAQALRDAIQAAVATGTISLVGIGAERRTSTSALTGKQERREAGG